MVLDWARPKQRQSVIVNEAIEEIEAERLGVIAGHRTAL